MKRLLMLVVLLVLLLVVADIFARFWIESKVESAAQKRLPDGTTVVASVNSFPLLARLGFTGKVQDFTIDLYDIESKPIDVSQLRLEMHDLRFDRGSVWSNPRITGVRFVELQAVISEDTIRDATGVDIRLFPDGATVKIGNNTETVSAELLEAGLELTFGSSFLETIPLPDLEVVPCDVQFRFARGALVFECTTNQVPAILVEAIGSVSLKELLD